MPSPRRVADDEFGLLAGRLCAEPRTWLVTGAAGFIGSNLAEALLTLDQRVVGLDDFSTGYRRNLDEVRESVGDERWQRMTFIEGDIRSLDVCRRAVRGVDYVLHQAALGSVPRSIDDPLTSHEANVSGFVNMLVACRDAGIRRVVYASSSSVYGDDPSLPKREDRVGAPLSPYAATKWANEVYADVFERCYALAAVGLRYFNVFGPRQDPAGAYAAVIPAWFAALARGETVYVNGDGETSRDFCYVANVVQANLLAATAELPPGSHVYNVAVGSRTTLAELFALIRERVARELPACADARPEHRGFRPGDVRHSLADISRAQRDLGYSPSHDIGRGLDLAAHWYLHRMPLRQDS